MTALVCMAQTQVKRGVLASGATRAGSPTHIIVGTVGQPFIGSPRSAAHRASIGFWYDGGSISTAVEHHPPAAPSSIQLEQNFPNPAIAGTTIRFSLTTAAEVQLVVTDGMGRTVQRIADGRFDAGSHTTEVPVGNLPAGIYFLRISAGKEQVSRKFVVLR
ncbi:MAG: T9SS type A sorting domain-containing protein [Bacteroidota bacterium]|nr:T9SS type A sorting domain-containing protein [Bacteroidota bacterium]